MKPVRILYLFILTNKTFLLHKEKSTFISITTLTWHETKQKFQTEPESGDLLKKVRKKFECRFNVSCVDWGNRVSSGWSFLILQWSCRTNDLCQVLWKLFQHQSIHAFLCACVQPCRSIGFWDQYECTYGMDPPWLLQRTCMWHLGQPSRSSRHGDLHNDGQHVPERANIVVMIGFDATLKFLTLYQKLLLLISYKCFKSSNV